MLSGLDSIQLWDTDEPIPMERVPEVPVCLHALRRMIVDDICKQQGAHFKHIQDILEDIRSKVDIERDVHEFNDKQVVSEHPRRDTWLLNHLDVENKHEVQQKEWDTHIKSFISQNIIPARQKCGPRRILSFLNIPVTSVDPPNTWLSKLVSGWGVGTFISTLVLANVLFIGIETSTAIHAANNGRFGIEQLAELENRDAVRRNAGPAVHEQYWFTVFHSFFAIFFVIELLIKLVALRWSFFFGHGWGMNMLDCLMVASSLIEFAFSVDVRHARLLRGFRMARVLRVIRIVAAFRELRAIVCSLYSSVAALFWSFVMMFTVMYCFCLVFVQTITGYLITAETDDPRAHLLAQDFGSIESAMFSLFQAIAGGADWRDMANCLDQASHALLYLFSFYIFIMVFGILNVLIGVFCEQASLTRELDPDLLIHTQQEGMSKFLANMQSIFMEIDKDADGEITWEEFRAYMQDTRVVSHLMARGLNFLDAKQLFRVCDEIHVEKDGKVDIDSFCFAMLRLAGDAKSTDLILVLHETRRQSKLLKRLIEQRTKDINEPKDAERSEHLGITLHN